MLQYSPFVSIDVGVVVTVGVHDGVEGVGYESLLPTLESTH